MVHLSVSNKLTGRSTVEILISHTIPSLWTFLWSFFYCCTLDEEGETALYQAAAAGSTECVQLLLLAGASASIGNEVRPTGNEL